MEYVGTWINDKNNCKSVGLGLLLSLPKGLSDPEGPLCFQ